MTLLAINHLSHACSWAAPKPLAGGRKGGEHLAPVQAPFQGLPPLTRHHIHRHQRVGCPLVTLDAAHFPIGVAARHARGRAHTLPPPRRRARGTPPRPPPTPRAPGVKSPTMGAPKTPSPPTGRPASTPKPPQTPPPAGGGADAPCPRLYGLIMTR